MWPFGRRKRDPIEELKKQNEEYRQQEKRARTAGQVNGRHYSKWADRVKSLKRQKKYDEAVRLAWACVDATEREDAITKRGVAPWCYEQLAIIFREQDKPAEEVAVLERYMHQRHAPGQAQHRLSARLSKARELKAKQKAAA